MVGLSNSGSLVEEGQALCQRGIQLAPTLGQSKTSWHNGRYTREWSHKIRRRLRMKVRVVSLVLDVSHGDCPIAVSAVNLVNVNWLLQTGTYSWGAHNTVLLGPESVVVASGEVWEEFLWGEVSVITRRFYTLTSGIILHISLMISRRGTWDFKNSCQNQQIRRFQFNIQTPSIRSLTVQPTAWTLDLMGITHM